MPRAPATANRWTYGSKYNRRYPLSRHSGQKFSHQKSRRGKKGKAGDLSLNQLGKFMDERAIESQKTMVQYHIRMVTNQNPSDGLYNCITFPVQPTGMDQFLPNYSENTEGQREIYIDYINIKILVNENDLEVNDTKRNFLRHFIVYNADLSDTTTSQVEDMFVSVATGQSVVEENMNAVIPQRASRYKTQDSGWLKYNAIRSESVSTGVTVTDVPNFVYPFRKYVKKLAIKKSFQIADNGTLIDWKIPTLALFFTGLLTASPDCTIWYDMYYKVLA